MTIELVVAHSSNGVIGRQGELPWRLRADLEHFKELTTGHTVVMGRKTFESLPAKFRPLPNRTNVVITRNPSWHEAGCIIAPSISLALEAASSERVFVIGGAQIYRLTLPVADVVHVTLIEDYVEGDTYFPSLGDEWVEIDRGNLQFDSHSGLQFRHLTYERKPDG